MIFILVKLSIFFSLYKDPIKYLLPYLHQFSEMAKKMQLLVLFGTNLHYNTKNFQINAETATFYGAIWNGFCEQYHH